MRMMKRIRYVNPCVSQVYSSSNSINLLILIVSAPFLKRIFGFSQFLSLEKTKFSGSFFIDVMVCERVYEIRIIASKPKSGIPITGINILKIVGSFMSVLISNIQ